jgi:hypothetical protein
LETPLDYGRTRNQAPRTRDPRYVDPKSAASPQPAALSEAGLESARVHVTWDDVTTHLITAALPLVFFGAYALFRRLYIRALGRAIYAPADEPAIAAPASTLPVATGLSIHRIDASAMAARDEPVAAGAARREAAAARLAYAASGGAFVLLGATLVYQGLRLGGQSWRAATVLAGINTFVGLVLILMFVRPRPLAALLTIALWIGCYFVLAVGIVRTSWAVAANVLVGSIPVTMSLPLVLIVPFALRTMRPLVVAFVPVVTLLIVLSTAMALVFDLLDVPLTDTPTVRSTLGGMVAAVLGVALVVRQIRRGLHASFVVAWLTAFGGAVLVLWRSGSLLAAFVLGVLVNGTFVLVSWTLLRLFLRLKALGYVPSETLHYTGCWVLYAVSLALAAQLSWSLLPALVVAFVIYLAILHGLLLRDQRPEQTPRRMLLLRVFQHAPIRSWLMDLLDDSWRRIGRIDTVVGLDLALHTLNALALEDFLRGRVRRQFVKNPVEVRERIAALPSALAIDRRYPLNELHCLPGTWQQVVTALLDAADVVLIDLRGLRPANRGVLYELALAVRRVPLRRLVVVTDARTDSSLVEQAAREAWTGPGDADRTTARSTLDVLTLGASASVNARAVTTAVFAVIN